MKTLNPQEPDSHPEKYKIILGRFGLAKSGHGRHALAEASEASGNTFLAGAGKLGSFQQLRYMLGTPVILPQHRGERCSQSLKLPAGWAAAAGRRHIIEQHSREAVCAQQAVQLLPVRRVSRSFGRSRWLRRVGRSTGARAWGPGVLGGLPVRRTCWKKGSQ